MSWKEESKRMNEYRPGARLDMVTDVISFCTYNYLVRLVLLGSHFRQKGKLSIIDIKLMIINYLGLCSTELEG